MMTDIVERLEATGGKGQGGPLKKEAADEIRKLRAIIASAQAAWQPIETAPYLADTDSPPTCFVWVASGGDDGKGAAAFGFCYRTKDGQVRARATGYWGKYPITHFRPLFERPSLSSAQCGEG